MKIQSYLNIFSNRQLFLICLLYYIKCRSLTPPPPSAPPHPMCYNSSTKQQYISRFPDIRISSIKFDDSPIWTASKSGFSICFDIRTFDIWIFFYMIPYFDTSNPNCFDIRTFFGILGLYSEFLLKVSKNFSTIFMSK